MSLRSAAPTAALLVLLTACGSAAPSAGGGEAGAIRVGMITAETGNLDFTTGRYGLELAIEKINAAGGVGGRTLELVTAEGGSDPAQTTSAARELVSREDVDILVGSQAVADCAVNAAFYAAEEIPVITPAYDPTCFRSDVLFPYMPPGESNLLPGLQWALDQGARTVGYVGLDAPTNQALGSTMQAAVEAAGGTWAGSSYIPLTGGGDITGTVLRFRQAGIDTVLTSLDPGSLSAALAAAGDQGIGLADGVRWVQATGGYGGAQAAALGALGEGLHVAVNNEPYEGAAPGSDAEQLAAAMRTAHPDVPADGFAAIGWAGGNVLAAVLANLRDGEPTRENLLAAARATVDAQPGTNPTTLDFSRQPVQVETHGMMVQLQGGSWVRVSDWIKADVPS